MEDDITIALRPGVVVTFQRRAGQYTCSCGYASADEASFRAHYRNGHSNDHTAERSSGIFSRVYRTVSYVASVLSTPTIARTQTLVMDDKSPRKRRRLVASDALSPDGPPQNATPLRGSTLSSHLFSLSNRLARSFSMLKPTDLSDDPFVFSIASPHALPVQDSPPNRQGSSLPLQSCPSASRRSISSISSRGSSPEDEGFQRRLFVGDKQLDTQSAASYLRSIGLFVHKPTNLVVCVQCASCIPAANVSAHVTSGASKCRDRQWRALVISDIDDSLRACGALRVITLPPVGESTEPIPIIPIVDGWMCMAGPTLPCYRECFASVRSLNRHFHDNHNELIDRRKYCVDVKLQRIYNFRGDQRHIRVETLSPQPNQPRYTNFVASCPSGQLLPPSELISLVTQPTVFESITKWDAALPGVDIKLLKSYARPPYAEAPEYDGLLDAIIDYITSVVAERVRAGGHRQLLQQIHSPEPLKLQRHPLRYPKKKETLTSYARIFSCYLTMLVRVACQPIPGFPVHMTDEQRSLCLELYSVLQDPGVGAAGMHKQIHKLAWALLAQHPVESTMDELNTPILRFLIAHHLVDDGDGNFKKSSVLSHTLSAIQWCWQALGYSECVRLSSNYTDGAFGAYRERVKPYLQETEHTPFTTLRTIIHINTAIAMNESTLPRFVMAIDKSYFSIDGHPITFAKFKQYAVDLIDRAETQLDLVLRGCDLGEIDTRIKNALRVGEHSNSFLDRLHDMGAGYSFFTDKRNPLYAERDRLLRHFLRDGCDDFAVSVPDLTPSEVFKSMKCRLWLEDVDCLVSTLYAAAVATWPGAGRGSELDHLTYRNEHGKRHIFLINNILTFVTTYIKTQQITGHAPLIPRGVDPRLARVFIITINFVYYAAAVICNQLRMQEHATAYTRYVFVFRGRPLNAERMTGILQENTMRGFQKEMGIRDWRHVMKFVLRHLADVVLEPDDDEEANKDPINALFGHGGRIGDHIYAIESSTANSISAVDVTRAQRYGIVYQRALGLWPSLPSEAINPDQEKSNELSSTDYRVATQVTTAMDASQRRSITTIIEDVLDRRLPALGDQLTSMVARALYVNRPQSNPPHLTSSCAVDVHPSRLDAVARLYNSTSFQSPQQAAMFEFILQNTYTIFGILPTGGGKSLMFYGPPLLETDGFTIVVSPFVALADEQFETAEELGIAVGRWPSKTLDVSRIRLLIVSAHAAGSDEFIYFLRACVAQHLVRRIIYDEAHQILMSAEYRDCYNTLHLVTQTGVVVHFLSATLLQISIDEIIRVARIPSNATYTIRAPTVRPNIRYDAMHFTDSATGTAHDEMMEQVETLCTSHADDLGDDGRILIYCMSYKECDEVRKRTGFPIHRAKGSTGDDDDDKRKRQAVAHDWRTGNPKTLIATTGFGNGIDYAHVRVVISINARNACDIVQQTGRAGRDGREAYAYILGSLPLTVTNIPDPDYAGVAMVSLLYAKNTCIRVCLGDFDVEVYSCVAHGNIKAILCARCRVLEFTRSISLIPAQPGPRNNMAQADMNDDFEVFNPVTPVVNARHVRPQAQYPTPPTTLLPSSSRHGKRKDREAAAMGPPPPPTPQLATTPSIPNSPVAPPHPGPTPPSANIRSIASSRAERLALRDAVSLTRKDHIALVDRFFIFRRAACLVCSLLGDEDPSCGPDLYRECASGLFNPYNKEVDIHGGLKASHEFQKFRTALKFEPSQKVCYRCLRHTDIDAHPHATTKGTCTEYADVIKNFAWAVFCLPFACREGSVAGRAWRSSLLESFDPQPPLARAEFEKWLTTTADPNGLNLTNIVLLCTRWMDVHERGMWPPA